MWSGCTPTHLVSPLCCSHVSHGGTFCVAIMASSVTAHYARPKRNPSISRAPVRATSARRCFAMWTHRGAVRGRHCSRAVQRGAVAGSEGAGNAWVRVSHQIIVPQAQEREGHCLMGQPRGRGRGMMAPERATAPCLQPRCSQRLTLPLGCGHRRLVGNCEPPTARQRATRFQTRRGGGGGAVSNECIVQRTLPFGP